jgi:hypothetical protein
MKLINVMNFICIMNKSFSTVAVIPMGAWNHRPWIEQGFAEEILRWSYYFMEDGLKHLRNTKGGRRQFTVIFDVAEVSLYKVSHYESKCFLSLE